MRRPAFPALFAAVAALLLPAALCAEPTNARGGEGFARLDRNGDGRIDRTEASASPRLLERFERIDRNGDGALDADELRKARRFAEARRDAAQANKRLMRARFEWLDRDGDGALTVAEIGDDAPKLRERFVAMDSNRDGRLVPEELQAYAKAQRDARRQRNTPST
jgi:Ca2+-binding EF-hand superfamily protein